MKKPALETTDLSLISRTHSVFELDFDRSLPMLLDHLENARVLVIGGAGSIGSSVVRILFNLKPSALHVVDLNENALADLVRSIRSSAGYVTDDFRTICFDPLNPFSDYLIEELGPYDYIFNFAAIKHVRSEKDRYTLSRMLDVNVRLMKRLTEWANRMNTSRLFSVSTDKAANPVNLMGASKRIMEMVGFACAEGRFSSARFANVAFSNGSLLNAFIDRLEQGQPLSAPFDVKRFFITQEEAARLCLLTAFGASPGRIGIPRAPGEIELTSFVEVAKNILSYRGYKPFLCESEEEARSVEPHDGFWPCFFFKSDTSGEKTYEEFIAVGEKLVESPFREISLIGKDNSTCFDSLDEVLKLDPLRTGKGEILQRLSTVIPEFNHIETGKNLDQRM